MPGGAIAYLTPPVIDANDLIDALGILQMFS